MCKIDNAHQYAQRSNLYPWYVRIACVLGIGFLQLGVFYITYQLYHLINYPFYINLETWLDRAVPYIAWSWIIYYFGFVYITFWGAAGIWRMPRDILRRTVRVYIWLVLTGGILHLIIPSDSPWPLISTLSAAQHGFKSIFDIEPLAGFPSMHAAMAVLPAVISLHIFRSVTLRVISVLLTLLVCISIITAKEHWAIDIPAGIVLGLVAAWAWRRYVWLTDWPAALKTTWNSAAKTGFGERR